MFIFDFGIPIAIALIAIGVWGMRD